MAGWSQESVRRAPEAGRRALGRADSPRDNQESATSYAISYLRYRRPGMENRPPAESAADVDAPISAAGLLISAEEILYDATDWWRWVVKLLGKIGLHVRYDSIYGVWRRDYLDAVNRHEIEYWPAFCQFLRAAGCSKGQISELIGSVIPRRQQFEAGIRSVPEVGAILNRLRNMGIRLSVVSCSPVSSDDILRRLEQVGLGTRFDQVVTAWDMETAASDPLLYRSVAARWNFRPQDLCMMGIDPVEIEAAEVAGMTTISRVRPADKWRHFRVDHIGDVPPLLRRGDAHSMLRSA